jgi:RHS repeat-associated protein
MRINILNTTTKPLLLLLTGVLSALSAAVAIAATPTTATPEPSYTILSVAKSLLEPGRVDAPYLLRTSPTIEGCAYGLLVIKDDSSASALMQSANAAKDARTRVVFTLTTETGNVCVINAIATAPLTSTQPRPAATGTVNVAEAFSGYINRFATAHKSAYRDFNQGKFDESVDPVSGRLSLIYNDVMIPGPNGHDIKVVRSYHSPDPTQIIGELSESLEPKFNGFGWNVYVNVGGVRGLHIKDTCVPRVIDFIGDYFFSIENMPSWITAEGRALPMMPSGGAWVTASGIRIACQFEQNGLIPVAVFPNGTRVELGQASSQTEQTIPGTEDGRRNNFLPTKMTDRWGNVIQFEYLNAYPQQPYGSGSLYGSSNAGALPISRITASDGREVNFRYGSDAPNWSAGQTLPLADFALKQIDYGAYSVKYGYTRSGTGAGGVISNSSGKYFLNRVERPDGKVWSYTNDTSGFASATASNPAVGQYMLSSVSFPQGGVTSYTWGFSTRFVPTTAPRTPRALSNQVRQKTTSDGGTWRYAYTDSVRSAANTLDDIPDPLTNLNGPYQFVSDPTNPPLTAFEGSRVTGPTGIEVFYHAPRFFEIRSGENTGAIGGPIQALGLIQQHSVYPLGSNFRNTANPPMQLERSNYTHEATYESMIPLRQGSPGDYGNPEPPLATTSTKYHSRVLSKTTTRGPRNATLSYVHTNGLFNLTCGEAEGATQQGQRSRRTAVTYGAYCQIINEVMSEGDGFGGFTRKKRMARALTADTKNFANETWYGPTDVNPIITGRYTYYGTGDMASKTDAVGSITRLNSYKRGTPQEELHPTVRGGDANTESIATRIRTTRVIDDLGRISSETDGEGRTVDFTYNGEHKPLSITLPRLTSARTIAFTYNSDNDVMTQGDRSEQVNYDGFGRVSGYFNGLFSTSFVNDPAGRRSFVSYPGKVEGQSVTFDALNRPTSFSEPNATGAGQAITSMVYADNEPSMIATNARGASLKTTYESFADPAETWIKTQVLPDNVGTMTYNRNVFGQPESIAYVSALDASANLTRAMVYDSANQYFMIEQAHPELGRRLYTRDANGNILRSSVQLGASNTGDTVNVYDGQNRLVAITAPAGSATPAPAIAQSWYRSGKLKSVSAGAVVRNHLFDENDNLTSETVSIDGVSRTLSYAYDALDHLSQTTYPSGDSAAFAPDVLGRPTQATPFVTSMSHHPSGLVASMSYANGVTQSFGEQASRPLPSSLGVTKSATNLLTLGFAYDAAVNLTTLSDATNLGYARNNSFDLFDRIHTSNSPSNAAANESFAYKGIGDFSNKTGATFNYDASTRRLASISAASAIYNRTYSYDLYGNATGDGRFNYEYDAYSNLRKSKQLSGATIAEYTYDGANHLAKKTSTNPPNGNANLATVHYLYTGGGKLFGEYPANSTGSAGGKEYIYASGKMVGQSVRGGASANPISGNGTGPLNNAWYLGKASDAATGLVYFGARWFDPQTGRFLGFDPADVSDDNPHSFNRYAYGNNNPYKYLDPDGREPQSTISRFGTIVVDKSISSPARMAAIEAAGQAQRAAELSGDPAALNDAGKMGAAVFGVSMGVVGKAAPMSSTTDGANAGRAGRQDKLRDVVNDTKASSADRGWIKQELNAIDRGSRSSIRNPPGKDLAHERGREAAKGYSYKHSKLQDKDLHRLQHKYDNFGKANSERPIKTEE